MSDHDGHTINVGPVTVGDKNVAGRAVQASPSGHAPIDTVADPIDTDAMRAAARPGDPNASEVRILCDGVERLSAENTALAAALNDIAGMRELPDGTWVADAECMLMRGRCWEHLGKPDGGPEEWCHTCVAEVAWCAWKLGVLR